MQIHSVQRRTKNKKAKLIGRGGKRGTYSGKGIKGQLARAGRKLRPELRDIIKKLPKLRGYRYNATIETKPSVVNLSAINAYFKAGDKVNPEELAKRGLVRRVSGVLPKVKILATGELAKAVSFEGVLASKEARAKIATAGASIA